MIIETKNLFNVPAGPTTSGRPFLNESNLGALSISSTFLADKKTLMNWIKRTPEAIGILRQIAVDVVTRINFVALPKEKKAGRPKANVEGDEEKASQFATDNSLKNQMRAAVMEGIALGDAYFWKGKINENDQRDAIKKTIKELGLQIDYKAIALDEDPVDQRSLQYVASSTMEIEVAEGGTMIKSFIQRTTSSFGLVNSTTRLETSSDGTNQAGTRKWLPNEILHYKFMELDGKVHGFTPMQSNFPIIKTLGAIKQYHGNWFEQGILPDIFFNFEDMDANSPAHEKMRQTVQEWYNNKRRTPEVTTGKFKIEEINKWNKDMEFRMLAIYYTGVIAFSIGMPLEKIRAILGAEIKSATGASDIGNTDYQRNIFDMQEDWENLFNSQFFNEEFNVDMKFERSAARDEIAEVQRDQQKINIIEKISQMDLIKKENMIDFTARYFPDVPREWLNPNPSPEQEMGMIASSKVFPPQGKQALSDEKKKQQEPQQKNKPPTGV